MQDSENSAGRESGAAKRLWIEHRVPGWSRVKEFDMSLVLFMRLSGKTYLADRIDPFFGFWRDGFGALEFDYRGKIVRFGIGMDAAEVLGVLQAVEKRFPAVL